MVTFNPFSGTFDFKGSGGGGTPGGADTQIQFNDGGSTFGGDAGFTYEKTGNTVSIIDGSLNITAPTTQVDIPLFIQPTDDINTFVMFEAINFAETSTVSIQDITTGLSLIFTGEPGLAYFGVVQAGLYFNMTASLGLLAYGIVETFSVTNNTADQICVGMYFSVTTGTAAIAIANAYGFTGSVTINDGDATGVLAGGATGVNAGGQNGANAIANAYGLWVTSAGFGDGLHATTVTNYCAYYMSAPSAMSGGTSITNQYGVYLENVNLGSTLNYAIYTNAGLVHFGDDIEIADGQNIILDTTTGTKIGTATSQKLGFFNHAPAIQPSAYTPTNVSTDRAYDANSTTLDEVADVLGTLITDLQGLGLVG